MKKRRLQDNTLFLLFFPRPVRASSAPFKHKYLGSFGGGMEGVLSFIVLFILIINPVMGCVRFQTMVC